MTTELTMLALSVVLGFAMILAAAQAATARRGLDWNAGPRDEALPPLTGLAGRLDRARANFLETFPFFAVAVLIAHVTGRNGALTFWGTQLYFWARIAYVPLYAAGIPYIRSLVWLVSVIGIALVMIALI